jgi:hypothetical protein
MTSCQGKAKILHFKYKKFDNLEKLLLRTFIILFLVKSKSLVGFGRAYVPVRCAPPPHFGFAAPKNKNIFFHWAKLHPPELHTVHSTL